MLNPNLIGFIPTVDADRAQRFYVDLLHFEFVADEHFALVLRSGPNMLRIVRLETLTPAPYTILGWELPNLRQTVADLSSSGLIFERYPYLEQDDSGIWTAPTGSLVAWFLDPDGNTLSFSQHEPAVPSPS